MFWSVQTANALSLFAFERFTERFVIPHAQNDDAKTESIPISAAANGASLPSVKTADSADGHVDVQLDTPKVSSADASEKETAATKEAVSKTRPGEAKEEEEKDAEVEGGGGGFGSTELKSEIADGLIEAVKDVTAAATVMRSGGVNEADVELELVAEENQEMAESDPEADPFPETTPGKKETTPGKEREMPEERKGVHAMGAKAVTVAEPKKSPAGKKGVEADNHDDSSGYESSAYSDDGGDANAKDGAVASTVPPQTTTKDANQSEVQGRSKDSPPPTPRIRGNASSSSSPQLSPHPGASGVAAGASTNAATSGWTSVVVLYTTSMSTVRKTAGQCQRVKQTLTNLGVEFLERDISMAAAYKGELKRRLGLDEDKPAPVPVPYLFIDDESVGGGDDLDDMAAEGYLKELMLEKGRTSKKAATATCAGCGGKRFVICGKCNGSMRLLMQDKERGTEVERRCPWCNEVGMSECEACVPQFARTTLKT